MMNWEQRAVTVLRLALPYIRRAPHALGQALSALDMHLSPPQEIAIVGPPDDPATVALGGGGAGRFPSQRGLRLRRRQRALHRPLLEGKGLVDGLPAVYICERFACLAPLTEPDAVAEALR